MSCMCKSQHHVPAAVITARKGECVSIYYVCDDEKGDVVLQVCRGDYHRQVCISPTGQSFRVYARKDKRVELKPKPEEK